MFESPYVKIDEHGIDLIKDYRVKEHIDYSEIKFIAIRKGHWVSSWVLSLCISLLLTGIGLVWGVKSAIISDLHVITSRHGKGVVLFHLIAPWMLFLGGSFWIYLSLSRCAVIIIKTQNASYRIPLKDFEKSGNLSDIADFLSERTMLINDYRINEK